MKKKAQVSLRLDDDLLRTVKNDADSKGTNLNLLKYSSIIPSEARTEVWYGEVW